MPHTEFERSPDVYRLNPQETKNLESIAMPEEFHLAEMANSLQTETQQREVSESLGLAAGALIDVDNPLRFDTAQRRLESVGAWTQETRRLASGINRLDLKSRGNKPLGFNEALAVIKKQAEYQLIAQDTEARKDGLRLASLVSGTERPDTQTQLESIVELLGDTENMLKGLEIGQRTEGVEELVREQRMVRDALLVKQELLMRESQRVVDSNRRDEDIERAREQVEKATNSADVKEKTANVIEIPSDSRERFNFTKDNFSTYDEGKLELFKTYLEDEIRKKAEAVPEGSRYPDNVAGVLGNAGHAWAFLRNHLARVNPTTLELSNRDFTGLSFSAIAEKYLDIKVNEIEPGYSEKFKKRTNEEV